MLAHEDLAVGTYRYAVSRLIPQMTQVVLQPQLLTIRVESISIIHQNDELISANIAQAANFYQSNGLLHGQSEIRAVDPTRTSIIGNFRFDYKASPYHCDDYPWYDHLFVKSHTQIECDPVVWKQAESLIRSDLPPAAGNRPAP